MCLAVEPIRFVKYSDQEDLFGASFRMARRLFGMKKKLFPDGNSIEMLQQISRDKRLICCPAHASVENIKNINV
jgi:hypothetical protein